MKTSVGFQFLLFNIIFIGVDCYSKNWVWSTKWHDKKNWDKNRIPCSNDQIILAEGVVYLKKNATISNLELTNNGEIVLSENMEITVEETKNAGSGSKDCPGESVRFIGNSPQDWFNPLNWNFMENGAVATWNAGSLYLDRIPCNYDNVYFPEANSFVVSLGSNAKVRELYLGKQSYSSAQLTTYFTSREGKMTFKRSGDSKVTVNQKSCQQNVGCPCGYAKMKSKICSKFVCPPACENKVTPEGDCCARCGALVKMNIEPGFNLNSCQNVLRSRLSKNFKNTILFMSPIEENNAVERVQILVTDKSDGKAAVSAAKETFSYLSEGAKVKECASFNVKVVTGKSGGDGGNTGKTTGKKDSDSPTVALAVTLSLVLVILALAGSYLLYRRRRRSNNMHVLHDEMNISGSRHIEMKDTDFIKDVLDFDSDYGKGGGSSFDNPMYDDMMDIGPAVIEPKIDDQRLEPVYAKPIRKSNDKGDEENQTKKKKNKKGKSSKSNGKSKIKKSESSDAFENPVYGHVQYTPDFDDCFDPAIDQPMPGDAGFSNPLYGDLQSVAKPGNLEEAMASEPPSFLDVIGFTPDDKEPDHLSKEGSVYEYPSGINVEIVGEKEDGFKGESEA